ncbi:Flp family type IVb pilin [Singulisphaera sp. PoT]|uniref:Flp family type IVb pilin n=1 Tax=Singulisphaera sp. PoT TaxID=3411797 RepID=UPI003BF4619D
MSKFFNRLVTGEEGATMVEYALMVALIAAALVGTVTAFSGVISTKFSDLGTTISGAGSTSGS